jgi:hypothetical protein
MADMPASSFTGGRQIRVRGFEVVIHTTRLSAERHLCFVFLADPYDDRRQLKIFKGRGPSPEEAEKTTLRDALEYLDRPTLTGPASILAGRSTLDIAGRKVDIFCDTVGEGLFQAFPFLYRPDGSRVLILRFHLDEAITGATPGVAMSECIRRLEALFERGGPEVEAAGTAPISS